MSTPLVSILLPTHNRPEVLACAIASVLQQSYTNFELQIVGDGCSESTQEVVRSFSDQRILWYDRPKGPGFGYANRNFALRQSQGEYIAYMTHDDIGLPDHLYAIWKESDDLPTHYQIWKNFYGQLGADLPPLLAMPLPAAKPPQHIYWHLLHQSPTTFTKDLRSGLAQVSDLWADAAVRFMAENLIEQTSTQSGDNPLITLKLYY